MKKIDINIVDGDIDIHVEGTVGYLDENDKEGIKAALRRELAQIRMTGEQEAMKE